METHEVGVNTDPKEVLVQKGFLIVHIEPKSLQQIWKENGRDAADTWRSDGIANEVPKELKDAVPEEMDVAIDLGLKTFLSDGVTPQPKSPFIQTRRDKDVGNHAKLLKEYVKQLRKNNPPLNLNNINIHPINPAFGSVLAQIDEASRGINPQKQGIFEQYFFEGLFDNGTPNANVTYGWDHGPIVHVHDNESLGRTKIVPVVILQKQNQTQPPSR